MDQLTVTSPARLELVAVLKYRRADGSGDEFYSFAANPDRFLMYGGTAVVRVSKKREYAIIDPSRDIVSPLHPVAVFPKLREAKAALRLLQ